MGELSNWGKVDFRSVIAALIRGEIREPFRKVFSHVLVNPADDRPRFGGTERGLFTIQTVSPLVGKCRIAVVAVSLRGAHWKDVGCTSLQVACGDVVFSF